MPSPRITAKAARMERTGVEALIEEVRQRFGDKAAVIDQADIEPWLTDWRGKFHGESQAILSPASTEEVAEIVKLASEHRVPLVPQGGNTGMVGGAIPAADGSELILSLRRLSRVRSIDAGIAVVEAGVILSHLHDQAAQIGQRFPLTLGARGSCTIGGLVSTNAGGTQVLKFGTMRSLVLGLEAVLPDGSIHDGLSGLKKDNRGYNLDQLLAGAEGTLGIVTAAALRLVPAVTSRAVAWVGLDSPHQALGLLRFMQSRTDRVEGFEIVPADALDLVLKHIPDTRNPLTGNHPWNVLIESTSEGPEDPSVLVQALLEKALEQGLIGDAALAANDSQAEAFWRIRDSISEAERTEGLSLAHDISVPVAEMPRFMMTTAEEVEQAFPRTVASGFGHLGDGNVHFHVRGDGVRGHETEISRLVYDLVTLAGGSISAEHGIGQLKLSELERLAPAAKLQTMRAIKRALDPQGLMNPGKLIR
ncbi:MAG: FAD-binding oxidoreductase [Sphingomonas sp.]|nr:FAD-binding oxidoreductase [Sphingomonas sp.]